MARARNIKPSFFQNEELGELSPLTRLAFIGMWTIADYKGCIEFRPKRLKVQLMPYDDCDFEAIANDLDKSGLIAIYTVAGQRYIKIINFEKHQNPHKNERESGSEIPDYAPEAAPSNGSKVIENTPEENGTAPADSLFLIPDSGFPSNCAEPQSDSTPAVLEMPLVGDKSFPILKSHVDEWTKAYPAVDVIRQLAAMRQWCLANPTRRKTARGVLAFCNSWLTREQDKPAPQARASPGGYESTKDRERRETIEGLTGRKNERSQPTIIDIN
jgi:hypothetical protein